MALRYEHGASFLEWLSRLGLDIEVCITNRLKSHPGGVLSSSLYGRDMKIIFEGDREQGWFLDVNGHSTGKQQATSVSLNSQC